MSDALHPGQRATDTPRRLFAFQPSGGERRRHAEVLANELSPRQREVLTLLLRGLAVKEIAGELDLSQHTVNEHVKALHRHFNVSSRGELLALFVPTFY